MRHCEARGHVIQEVLDGCRILVHPRERARNCAWSVELCGDCPVPVSSWLRAAGWRQHPHPLTVLFIYRHNINRGRGDEKCHLAQHLPTQTALCLQQGLCKLCAVGGRARGTGSTAWGSQLVDQKAVHLSVAEPPLLSESSISTGRPPWSSHGQPLTWKRSRKAHAKMH